MSYKIVKNLTKINFTDKNKEDRIEYIVIHYFGSLGSAKSVSDYFKSGYRGASAHYSLDEDEEVYQSVEDEDIAWHCGTSGEYFSSCRNSNSLGIEVQPFKIDTSSMKASDKDWFFAKETEERLIEFVSDLMDKYKVPLNKVIRHYDVTHKLCPRPYVGEDINSVYLASGNTMWLEFVSRLKAYRANGKVVSNTTKEVKQNSVVLSPSSEEIEDIKDYKVRVLCNELNIRKGPGTSCEICGVIKDKGVYTITHVRKGSNWGKLKSGLGWIHLGYTEKVK